MDDTWYVFVDSSGRKLEADLCIESKDFGFHRNWNHLRCSIGIGRIHPTVYRQGIHCIFAIGHWPSIWVWTWLVFCSSIQCPAEQIFQCWPGSSTWKRSISKGDSRRGMIRWRHRPPDQQLLFIFRNWTILVPTGKYLQPLDWIRNHFVQLRIVLAKYFFERFLPRFVWIVFSPCG